MCDIPKFFMTTVNILPSPGSLDSLAQVMTLGEKKDDSTVLCSRTSLDIDVDDHCLVLSDSGTNSSKSPIRHQELPAVGGVNENMRVVFCNNINIDINYIQLYNIMLKYGNIKRIKFKLSHDEKSFEGYIIFEDAASAKRAQEAIKGKQIPDIKDQGKLYDIRNVKEEIGDFIPKTNQVESNIDRKPKTPTWFIATYKEGHDNLVKARRSIENHAGTFSESSIKRYGRNVLLKAKDKTQSALLSRFKPESGSCIQFISPHKSFNTARGVVYSKDIYEFSEEEILQMCPPNIYQVKKLKGINNAILLTFESPFLPDYIKIERINLSVKKFKQRPMQCHKCYEYGHTALKCQNRQKCYVCSKEHDLNGQCSAENFCFHCNGGHSPNSRICRRYNFEQDALELANTECISIGSAKRKLKGANRSPDSTYASVIKNMKTPYQSTMTTKISLHEKLKNHPNQPPLSQRTDEIIKENPQPQTSASRKTNTKPSTQSKNVIKSNPHTTPLSLRKSSDSLLDMTKSGKDYLDHTPMELDSTMSVPSSSGNMMTNIHSDKSESVTSSLGKTKSEDGFEFPSNKKRNKSTPPKENKVLRTSNSFSTLPDCPDDIDTTLHGNKDLGLPKPLTTKSTTPITQTRAKDIPSSKVKRLNKLLQAWQASSSKANLPGNKSK